MKRLLLLMSCAWLLFGVVGSGGGSHQDAVVPAAGKVTLDGKPVGPTKLVFKPVEGAAGDARPVAGAAVAADGSFTVSTYGDGDGAAPGKYEVSVSTIDSMTDPAAMGNPSANISALPMAVEIPADGKTDLQIDLKGGKTAKPRAGQPLGT